mmetsp:Transcript_32455/g.85849  ORF Transcript_32455/g.85849 Transcript_32455/m.85849 type:complete len:214 (-) Transcript_32455:63-704(-)
MGACQRCLEQRVPCLRQKRRRPIPAQPEASPSHIAVRCTWCRAAALTTGAADAFSCRRAGRATYTHCSGTCCSSRHYALHCSAPAACAATDTIAARQKCTRPYANAWARRYAAPWPCDQCAGARRRHLRRRWYCCWRRWWHVLSPSPRCEFGRRSRRRPGLCAPPSHADGARHRQHGSSRPDGAVAHWAVAGATSGCWDVLRWTSAAASDQGD